MKRAIKNTIRNLQLLIYLLLIGGFTYAQNIDDISFGTDATFEIVTWNIEHFPKNNQTTIDYVSDIMKAIDADVYAIQEVDNVTDFNTLLESLPDYGGYITSDKFRGLAYIYKKSTITVNAMYEIYNSSDYYRAFPRYPMVMDLVFKGERMIVINNHYKCCGDGFLNASNPGDEETRRAAANSLLKAYIDVNFSDLNVLLVGDLNDILTDRDSDNVFNVFLNDPSNYKFVDLDIAQGNSTGWSFPTWPSHLDHILINKGLFDEFTDANSVVEVIRIEEYLTGGWATYDSHISDHRPVAFKFTPASSLDISEEFGDLNSFDLFPNPVVNTTTISFKPIEGSGHISVYSSLGQKVYTSTLSSGQDTLVWEPKHLTSGVYFVQLTTAGASLVTRRILVLK